MHKQNRGPVQARPFSPEQLASRRPGGTRIGARFLLVEVRADWPALSSTLGFPQWNCRQGLCYKCMAHVDNFMDMDPEAPWRRQRLTHEEFTQHNTAPLSPLWHTTANIKPDWLHVMDEGVAKGDAWWLLETDGVQDEGGQKAEV